MMKFEEGRGQRLSCPKKHQPQTPKNPQKPQQPPLPRNKGACLISICCPLPPPFLFCEGYNIELHHYTCSFLLKKKQTNFSPKGLSRKMKLNHAVAE